MIFSRDEGEDQAHATLELNGEIDMAVAPALRQLEEHLPLRELQRLTIDMGAVRFMDSTGIGFLVSLRKRMLPEAELAVVNASPPIARVVQITGLESFLGLVVDPAPRTRSLPDSDSLDRTG
ncbi:MAG: STAS domain-containing protein [Mycobacteriales bacterium]